jgi:hypothetical protein
MIKIGYGLLALSFIVWGLVFLLPFSDLTAREITIAAAVVYAISYGLFFAGGLMAGKKAVGDLKRRVLARFGWSKSDPDEEPRRPHCKRKMSSTD